MVVMVDGCSLGEVSVLESDVVIELDSVGTVPGENMHLF